MTYSDLEPDVQRVRYEVRRFRQHLITYIAVMAVLFLVNAATGGFWYGHWWFFWIALIWGVILALEGAHLFGDHIGPEWEDRMVAQVVAWRRGQPPPGPARPPYSPPPPPGPPAGSSVYSGLASSAPEGAAPSAKDPVTPDFEPSGPESVPPTPPVT
ncbi:MAG TPA: 2TM domain-containing protein [Rhizomicrobium sp.]|jgi:hypothetical protein|nr:2TM domain-containing protein [Rhizomicrobium sp.]